MTISVVLVIIAIVTLGVGWISGQDPMIYVSILSSVIAGLLLIKSVLDDRRARTAAALAGTSTITETSGYRPLEAEPVSMRDEPTMIGGDEEEEEMVSAEDLEPELATVGATRSTRGGRATARRTTKPAASRAKTKTASRAKTSATRAKTSAKAKTTKAKTAAKPKTGGARAKTTAKPKASTAKKSTAKKSTAKKSTAKKSTTRR